MREEKIREFFEKVGLNCWVAKKPIVRTDDDRIFQMTIRRERGGSREHFGIYCGSEKNEVFVLDVDYKRNQVLLFVREPRRKFRYFEPEPGNMFGGEWKSGVSDANARKYLMGLDETHYFITQLPRGGAVNKVEDAHRVLRPSHLERKGRLWKRAKRQGEWFFIPATEGQKKRLAKMEKASWKVWRHHPVSEVGMQPAGSPHEADEYLELNIKGEIHQFVRGKIRHPDHRTTILDEWHQVFRNLEIVDPVSRRRILGWVD